MRMLVLLLAGALALTACGAVAESAPSLTVPPAPTSLQAHAAGATRATASASFRGPPAEATRSDPAGRATPPLLGFPTIAATQTAVAAGRGRAPSATPSAGTPTPAAAALFGDWALVTIQSADQEAQVIAADGPDLVFRADGRYRAQGDCNALSGRYTADERGALRLAPGGVTLVGCQQMALDRPYFATLGQVRGYALAGGTLRLTFDQPGLQLVYWRGVRGR